MLYSPAQLLQFARNAGFQGKTANTMTAIALAESGGNQFAHNTTAPDDSIGPWQINFYGPNITRVKQYGLKSKTDAFNPDTNARLAKSIFDSQGLSAWSTFSSGAYKQFLPQVEKAAASLPDTQGAKTGQTSQAPQQPSGTPGTVNNYYILASQPSQNLSPAEQFREDYKNKLISQAMSGSFTQNTPATSTAASDLAEQFKKQIASSSSMSDLAPYIQNISSFSA